MSSYRGSGKIETAANATARFAAAAENLDIDVAVIDFINDEARVAKPASVGTEHAIDSLTATDTGGGTPLADALSLSQDVVEANRSQNQRSLILTITDGKPAEVDEVEEEIHSSRAPICSLTIATDCAKGNPPRKAEQLQSEFRITDEVYDKASLDDKLDSYASLLGRF